MSRRSERGIGRAGAALLEVIVALTVLAVAGIAAVQIAQESMRAVERARAADAELREADAFLEAVALWTRRDLDLRLGSREQGPFRLVVERPARTLYVVTLTDSTGTRELLRTALFRPDSTGSLE